MPNSRILLGIDSSPHTRLNATLMGALNTLKKAHLRWRQRRLTAGLDTRPLRPDEIDASQIRRALIVLPNWRMGNLLLITPIAQWLREGLIAKGATNPVIDICSGGNFAAVLQHNPHVRQHISIPGFTKPSQRRALMKQLADEKYDLVHLATYGGTPIASRIVLSTRARYRTGAGSSNEGVLNILVKRGDKNAAITERHRTVLENLGFDCDPTVDLTMVSTEEELSEARATIDSWNLGEGRRPLGIFFVGHRSKQMPLPHWAQIITRIREDHPQLEPVVFCAPGDAKKLIALQSALGDRPIHAIQTSIRKFAALVECMAAIVACDCGPMHMARAKRRPIVSLFTKDNWDKFAPTGPGRVCLCRKGGPTPAEVSDALRSILK